MPRYLRFDPGGKSVLKKNRSVLAGLAAAITCAFVWWWFRPSLLNYESYLYAAGIEGFIDISALYNVFVPEIRMPDFGRFHPNHPLPHLLVFWLRAGFASAGFQVPAIEILTGLNLLCSAAAIFAIYRIAATLTADRTISVLFALVAGFSPVFWFSAVSAETYEIAYCLMVIAFMQMLPPYRGESVARTTGKALLFSLAFCFHFGVALFAIPVMTWYLVSAVRRRNIRPVLSLTLFGVISLGVFLLVYVLAFMSLFGTGNLYDWWKIFTMQSRIPMGGQYTAEQIGLWNAAETLFTSLSNGLLSGQGNVERIARVHLMVGFGGGVFFVLRRAASRSSAAALAAWIIVPLGFLLLVMRSPTNMTYSLMLMLPVFLVVLLLVKRIAPLPVARAIVMGWLLVTVGSTFAGIIRPKAGLPEETVYFASRIPESDVKAEPVVALAHNYYGIFPDLYYLGNRRGLRADIILFHYDQAFPEKLLAEIRTRKKLQLLTDRLLLHEEAWLRAEGIQVERVFFHSELHSPDLYWFSIRPRFSVAAGYRRELSLYRLRAG
ncbi:MAG: hypothetical protein ACOY5B_01275 [Spirochaetota bacterium]